MKTINNEHDYWLAYVKVGMYDDACMAWIKANKTNGIPKEVNQKFPFADIVDNDLRSALEVYEFIHDKPEKYFLYIDEKKTEAITWTGQKLGSVWFGREFRDNFGGKRQPITVCGINGVKYAGTYYKSSGNYARIKAVKNQKA